MAVQREFLGLDQPALHAATDYLLNAHRVSDGFDLRDALVVVPGGRAGRRLQERMFRHASRMGGRYIPPEVTTIGQLPELLYRAKRPFASDWVVYLAWSTAIHDSAIDVRSRVFPHAPRDNADSWSPGEWLALGKLLHGCYRELASESLTFAHVAEKATALPGFPEIHRWHAMAVIQNDYLRILDDLQLWDRQTARLVAIERNECTWDRPIYMVATADLTHSLCAMLDQVASRVTALVHAPSDWSDGFDGFGCILRDYWERASIPLSDDQIVVADSYSEQASATVHILSKLEGIYACDQISIGCADEGLVPYVQRVLATQEINGRWGPGRRLAESGPYRLLEVVRSLLRSSSFDSFASLVRHPDVGRWLSGRGKFGWIYPLDQYRIRHLPGRVADDWLGEWKDCDRLAEVAREIRQWLRPLKGARPLGEWATRIRRLLAEVYGDCDWSAATPAARFASGSARMLQAALVQLSLVPARVTQSMDASAALELFLEPLRDKSIADPADPDAVELVGWLELPLDDAPCLIALGLNEGTVPRSSHADMFLPDSLRQHLGIEDHVHRLARDAYALRVMVESKQSLHVVVGRRDSEGDPMKPSRLLFADEPEVISRRWLRFLESESPLHGIPTLAVPAGHDTFGFDYARPVKQEQPLETMRTTDFRLYLSCPYRFYLRRVLGLERVDDTQIEMGGALFGTVVHDVMAGFGRGAQKDSTDALAIRQELERLLEQTMLDRFGQDISPALRVQVEQMKLRLVAFAQRQAAWRSDGWRIAYVEAPEESTARVSSPSGSVRLSGRIDRIDVHEEDGRHVILDYKTSDSGKTPKQTHLKDRGRTWIDLQLPLYRRIALCMGITDIESVGYVLLPKNLDDVKFCLAGWTDPDFEAADRIAEDVVDGVLRQVFEPPRKPTYAQSDEFSSLLFSGVQERPPWNTDSDGSRGPHLQA